MASFASTALRTFDSDIAPLLKGLSIAKVAPFILVAFIAFFLFKLFLDGADSKYTPYARSLALTAANVWDSRNEIGLSPNIRGRTLASMEPLMEVLDALSNTVRKYESQPQATGPHFSQRFNQAPNAIPSHKSSRIRFQ